MLKKFEVFNFIPDKKILDEEMARRVPKGFEKMDKEGIIFGIEKQMLEKYGFIIKENTREYENFPGFGMRKIYYSKVKQVAEASDSGFDIVFFKISPERYDYVYYMFVIIKNGKILDMNDTTAINEYKRYDEGHINGLKEKSIIDLFNKLYFCLYDLKEKEGNRKVVDPFGEENW